MCNWVKRKMIDWYISRLTILLRMIDRDMTSIWRPLKKEVTGLMLSGAAGMYRKFN